MKYNTVCVYCMTKYYNENLKIISSAHNKIKSIKILKNYD